MKTNFSEIVDEVIKQSDIVLEILDSRFPEKTRNKELEDKIRSRGKRLIYVLNKCDLVSKEQSEKLKRVLKPSIFVSSVKRLGTTVLLKEILKQATYFTKERIIVGVTGYPNTGKSSVINALVGRHSARTSPVSGFTKGKQLIKLAKNIYLMDTPGIFSYNEDDQLKNILTASKDPSKIRDATEAARQLIKTLDGKIESHYGVEKSEDVDQTLETIALKFHRLRKGGFPDVDVISRKIIQEWQRGKIK